MFAFDAPVSTKSPYDQKNLGKTVLGNKNIKKK